MANKNATEFAREQVRQMLDLGKIQQQHNAELYARELVDKALLHAPISDESKSQFNSLTIARIAIYTQNIEDEPREAITIQFITPAFKEDGQLQKYPHTVNADFAYYYPESDALIPANGFNKDEAKVGLKMRNQLRWVMQSGLLPDLVPAGNAISGEFPLAPEPQIKV